METVITKGNCYTRDDSGLIVRVAEIVSVGNDFIEMDLVILNKSMGFMYDMKRYKTVRSIVETWKTIPEKV